MQFVCIVIFLHQLVDITGTILVCSWCKAISANHNFIFKCAFQIYFIFHCAFQIFDNCFQ